MAQVSQNRKLSITVKAGSKKPGIEKSDESNWIVRVREPAVEGRANEAVLRAIAEELKIPGSSVRLLRGGKSKKKVVEIVAIR
jgi:hypothetical protein